MRWISSLVVPLALFTSQAAASVATPQNAKASLRPEQIQAVDGLMRHEMQKRNIVGAALGVVSNGQVLHAQGYGFADLESSSPVTPDTRFMIASMTKMFVASATMLLVRDEKLSLDQTIGSLLRTVPEAWRGVTVRQLLTHASGIPSFTAFDSFPCPPKKTEAEYVMGDVLQEVACLPLDFSPGSDFGYSETNYHLLAMLIEQASGRPYEEFMLTRVLRPLGMRHTAFMKSPDQPDRRAVGHVLENGKIKRAPDLYPMVELGLVSSIGDLARFDEALAKGRLLPRSVLERMWTPAGIGKASYGMGFSTRPIDGRRQVGHTGGGPAAATSFARFVDHDLTVILLTNTSQPPTSIQSLVDTVADVVLDPVPASR